MSVHMSDLLILNGAKGDSQSSSKDKNEFALKILDIFGITDSKLIKQTFEVNMKISNHPKIKSEINKINKVIDS